MERFAEGTKAPSYEARALAAEAALAETREERDAYVRGQGWAARALKDVLANAEVMWRWHNDAITERDAAREALRALLEFGVELREPLGAGDTEGQG